MRLLNLLRSGVLVFAAAYVYEIKFESTLRAERVAKMRGDIRRERDAIAALRAEWATLENPARIQGAGAPSPAARPDRIRRSSTRSTACRSARRRSCSRRSTMRSPSMIENPDDNAPTGSIPEEAARRHGTLPERDEHSRWTHRSIHAGRCPPSSPPSPGGGG